MDQVRVEILHTTGCPHGRAVRRRIDALARGEGIPVSVTETVIQTLATSRHFTGSPTILVDGGDVAPQTAEGPEDFGLG